MRDQRLLERINRLASSPTEQASERSSKGDEERLIASVREHLRNILNTRKGSVPIDPDYGIRDFSVLPGSFATPETQQIEREIARAVERFEPRVTRVRVHFNGARDEESVMGFSLSAVIKQDGKEFALSLDTGMSASGDVEIS